MKYILVSADGLQSPVRDLPFNDSAPREIVVPLYTEEAGLLDLETAKSLPMDIKRRTYELRDKSMLLIYREKE